uniref:HIT domain-containing protein n=1 Tax=Neolamprologus brichardi TaxID=32507 RepID=A0A3Q4HEA5_NEOBR
RFGHQRNEKICRPLLTILFPDICKKDRRTIELDISCFRDIKPGAPHHYLVVPTKHVGNCKSLTKDHVPLGKV